jgi:homoserine O-acetyltransferase
MINHDISAPFQGSWERVGETVQADTLVVVATQDHVVNPTPALELARILGAQVVELTGPCGHIAFICEREVAQEAVEKFLIE